MNDKNFPVTIYMQFCGECKGHDCGNCDISGDSTWCVDKVYDRDVPYFSERAVRELLRREYRSANARIITASMSATDGILFDVEDRIDKVVKELKGGEK